MKGHDTRQRGVDNLSSDSALQADRKYESFMTEPEEESSRSPEMKESRPVYQSWHNIAPTEEFYMARHPIFNTQSIESAKSPRSVAKTMDAPKEKVHGHVDMKCVARPAATRQECSSLVSKLSRDPPSKPPPTPTDLTSSSHRYSANRPMPPNASNCLEPVLQGTLEGTADRENVDSPISIVKSLPSCLVLPPVTNQGSRMLADVVVLTPERLGNPTSVHQGEQGVNQDDTFIVMPKFEEFFQSADKSLTFLTADEKEHKKWDEKRDGYEDDSCSWIDDGPDASYDFKSDEAQ